MNTPALLPPLPEPLRVLVLMGGPDAERAVSLESGQAVAEALRAHEHLTVHEETIVEPGATELAELVAATRTNIVFPALHGPWGEGGPLQSLLETIDVPFVGSGSAAAQCAMDKIETKRRSDVATPPAARLTPGVPCPIDLPVVIKPIDDGSSVDLAICETEAEFKAGRARLEAVRPDLMVEGYIRGREVTVGWVNGRALPLMEIVPATRFYDYDAKYERNDTAYVVDPPVPRSIASAITDAVNTVVRATGVRDLARIDFIIDDETAWMLEINTMPGFTSHSLLPMAAAAAGLDMPTLTAGLVALAHERAAAVTGSKH